MEFDKEFEFNIRKHKRSCSKNIDVQTGQEEPGDNVIIKLEMSHPEKA